MTQKFNKVPWHSTANPSRDNLSGSSESPKRRRMIPKEKLREWAMESSDGGRAFCECCHHYFAMYYIRRVKLQAFRTGLVCVDCKKEKGLQEIK
jgi:hypothetical protein